MKRLIFLSFIFILLPTLACDAGWFEKEKEIKDEYLERLFTPDFPYAYVKVVEDFNGNRFIVVKLKEKVSKEILAQYTDLLLSRGVSIYGLFHYGIFSWQKTVSDFAITITRKVEGEPDTIEASISVVKDPEKNRPVVATTAKDKEIRIAIEKDFGKKWKKIKLIPEIEQNVKEPTIGRYPGAKLLRYWTTKDGKGRYYYFIAKDSLRSVGIYLYEKTKEKYKKVGKWEYQEAIINNPNYRRAIEVFGIKTLGKRIAITGSDETEPSRIKLSRLHVSQSLDSNLKDYVEIEIEE